MTINTCVIVSFWSGRTARNLHALLEQMMRVDAGATFDLVIVNNGGDQRPLRLPSKFSPLRYRIINRQNLGYNIGAWECGWRSCEGYTYYLFLQDECFLKRPGWIFDFEYRMSTDAHIGLLGESIVWDRMTWQFIRQDTDRSFGPNWWGNDRPHPVLFYQQYIAALGIDRGEVGTHLQSLVLFSSHCVLESINGFPVGATYDEAVSCEIGISRLIESKGYRISKVKDQPFALIGHRQWTENYQRRMRFKNIFRLALRNVMPRRGPDPP